jgi:hypothetical protein
METYGRDEPPLPIIEAIKYNAEMYIAFGENALQYDWLTAEDRAAIHLAMGNLKIGLCFIDCTTPDELRDAAFRLMVGAEIIGERCTVCDSEKEYRRRQRCAKGGRGDKEKRGEKRKATKAWRAYARTVESTGAGITITALAESLLVDRVRPAGTPSNLRTLEKFLSKARKERLAAGG